MSLIHPALIYAAGLAVIPVILHFLLRAKPKKLVFPALRLILLRRRQNVRRLRLRHVWLMLLRVLVILGIVAAVVRPSLPEASYELSTREWVTLFAIIAAALGSYFGLMQTWRKKRVSVQALAYRRTLLRGGLGTAVAVLIALAVVLPYVNRLRAEISAPAPAISSDLPVAAVFLFDTSLSMQYTQQGKTRLDQAKAIALDHLDSLPPRSRVAIGETANMSPILFQADSVGARSKIQSLAPQPVSQPLNERLRAALALQLQDQGRTLDDQASVPQADRRDRFIREVYLFTDLAATAWRSSAAAMLKEELDRLKWVGVYVIDVGETAPRDVGITDVVLSRQSVSAGSAVTLEAVLSAVGVEETEKTIELSLLSRDGKSVKQDQKSVKVGGQQGARVQLSVVNLQGPVQQGELRLISSDPLPMNDVRYFTIQVLPPTKIMLITPSAAVGDFLREALAPPELARTGKARYEVIAPKQPLSQLTGEDFRQCSVVALNSVPTVTDATWKLLQKYVSNGGGLAVILGSSAFQNEPNGIVNVNYGTDAAQAVLPAWPIASLSFSPPVNLDLKNLNHPALKKLEEFGGAGELTAVEIRKRWTVELADGANVLIAYTNPKSDPALIERRIGSGRAALLTTAAHLRGGWNDLPLSWSFLVFADQLMQYLAGHNEAAFNYPAGEEVLLRVDADPPPLRFLLRKPGGQQSQNQLAPGTTIIAIRETDQVGHYEVLSADPQSKFERGGFSVNASPAESDFRRLTEDDLAQLLGEKRFSLARDVATLQRSVTTGRLGEEVYPLILLVALLVFCGEHIVANWFYSDDSEQAAAA